MRSGKYMIFTNNNEEKFMIITKASSNIYFVVNVALQQKLENKYSIQ